MKTEEIQLQDWQRILLGEAPIEFMVEVLLRAIIVYLFLLLAIRILGKRMAGQMSIYELAVVVMLGAIIAIPMQVPDKGILIGVFILFLTVFFHWGLNKLSFKSKRWEHITQGSSSMLLKNGKLLLNEINRASISRESLFANLRGKGIKHLGQLDRIYLESSGDFSIFTNNNNMPGLSILPDKDNKLKSNSRSLKDCFVCISCGRTENSKTKPIHQCPDCGNKQWTEAIR